MRSYTLHVTFLADDDTHAIARGRAMVVELVNAADDDFAIGVNDWDVSDTVDWAEIIDRSAVTS